MAITQRLATTTTGALDFVFQASADTAVTTIHLCNITSNDATINIYLTNSVGIGEHPQHLDEINKLVEKIANAKEKIEVLEEFEPEKGTTL